MSERLKCSETRKDGEPCNAFATTTGKCAGHSRMGATSDPEANAAKSAEVRQAKAAERHKSLLDRIADRLEARADTIITQYEKAAADGDWRANEALITRVYGKPVERVETITNDLNPASMTSEQRAELRRQLVAANPELLELVPAGDRVTSSVNAGLKAVNES